MAKDRTTTARELSASDDRPSLSEWLVRDLRVDRPSQAPEELESGVAATMDGEAAADAEPQPPTGTDPEGVAVGRDEVEGDAARELAESMSYAREADPVDHAAADAALAGASDWDEEDDALFSSTGSLDGSAVDEEAEVQGTGESLSPQVLSDEEEDSGAAFVLPGAGHGSGRWKAAAAIATAALLAFFVVHRKRPPHAPAAHESTPEVIAQHPAPPPPPAAPEAETPKDDDVGKAPSGTTSRSGTGSYRRVDSDAQHDDVASPGGPSVGRFPDLPRQVLDQLEKAFEAEQHSESKSSTGSVERY